MATRPEYRQFNFNNIPVLGLVPHTSATAPTSPVAGQLWTDTSATPHVLKQYDGSSWVAVGFIADGSITDAKVAANAAIALSKLAVDPLARANHTGTQTAATISDFDTQVRSSRLDQMAAPTAAVDANGQTIDNVAAPATSGQAANKGYVDAAADAARAGFAGTKDPVRVVAAPGFDVTNPGAAIDGVTMAANDRFLVPDAGIYVFNGAGSAATVAPDAGAGDILDGTTVAVADGTHAGEIWIQRADVPGGATPDWGIFNLGGLTYTVSAPLSMTGQNITLPTLPVGNGGTGATTAAGARTNLGAAGAYGETIAMADLPGSGTERVVTHSLNAQYVSVTTILAGTGARIDLDWRRIDNNSVGISSEIALDDDVDVLVQGV